MREALREQYGYAMVNGERVELGNYVVEPSGIFMGRGKHPLRGRWKEGARHADITLNLSPDAPRPPGEWGEIVWQPESLWVARWKDKLSGKLKYVWLSDTAPIKQEREARKFDKAHELHAELDDGPGADRARSGATTTPSSGMIATACYLIDALCLRVGDEKDPDEADTVGATTLRPEHVTLHPDGTAEFRFLGKDSVLWHKKLELPDGGAREPGGADPQRPALQLSGNGEQEPSHAGQAAALSRHQQPRRQRLPVRHPAGADGQGLSHPPRHHGRAAEPGRVGRAGRRSRSTSSGKRPTWPTWKRPSCATTPRRRRRAGPRSRQRYQERREKAEDAGQDLPGAGQDYREALADLREEAREKQAGRPGAAARPGQGALRQADRRGRAPRGAAPRHSWTRPGCARDKIKAQASIAAKKRTWNLGTSLKSYIDPRVYYEWGQQVDYDVLETLLSHGAAAQVRLGQARRGRRGRRRVGRVGRCERRQAMSR